MSTETKITADLLRTMPLPEPKEGSKDERGAVLIVGGSVEVPGAVVLAATAAMRVGAGKLQIATVASAATVMAVTMPEAMVTGFAEAPDGGFDPRIAAKSLPTKAEKCDAVLIGPGMTEGDGTAGVTAALLPCGTSVVLDAAAVCGLAPHAPAVRACRGRVVITPHAGEMAQLLDRTRDAIEADPLDASQAAAELLGAVVVMKGAQTLIVAPDGAIWRYAGGGVGLATSGSGDVLAGIITGLLARGASPAQAAVWGVFLHGEAGSRLSRSIGPLGFLARELAGEIPVILRDLG